VFDHVLAQCTNRAFLRANGDFYFPVHPSRSREVSSAKHLKMTGGELRQICEHFLYEEWGRPYSAQLDIVQLRCAKRS